MNIKLIVVGKIKESYLTEAINEYVKRIFLAKLKIQLGVVRKKFSSVQLIGGGTIDTTIGDEGKEEMNQIMEQLRQDESFGNLCFVGE